MSNFWRHVLAILWLAVITWFGYYDLKTLSTEGKIQFDLLALLPQGNSENMRMSKQLIDDSSFSGKIVIAFGHADGERSKLALEQFRKKLYNTDLPILEQDIRQIEAEYKNFFKEIYPYRAGLISKEDRKLLEEGQDDVMVLRGISNIMSPFGSFNSSQIHTDPFGFFSRFVTSLGIDHSVQVDMEGNLVVNGEDKVWHIFQGGVTDSIFSLKMQEKISNALLPVLKQLENEFDVEVLRVGAAFYSSAGAQQAQNEISMIGLMSTVGIVIIMLVVFRLPHPIFFAIAVVASGLLCGLTVCLSLFGSIHILALVFGSSLVGVAVDYAIHYSCASLRPVDRFHIFSYLLPAMPLGVLTSSIGYGALVVTPFPGIQQMAILACSGLLCTFISVALWGPYFIRETNREPSAMALKIQNYMEQLAALGTVQYLRPILTALLLAISIRGAFVITFEDNVRSFQSMDPNLKMEEEQIKSIMRFNNSTKFLAIQGTSLEAVLQKEEEICLDLDKDGISYRTISDLLPSQKLQQENSGLKLEFCETYYPVIAKTLELSTPFNKSDEGFDQDPLFASHFINKLPTGWKELFHADDTGMFTGRIMILNGQENLKEYPGAVYIDPIGEYTPLFSSYRMVLLTLIAGLLVGFILVIAIRQGIKASIAITSPVFLAMAATMGIIGQSGIGFSMFHAMGLILVLCIGIDYGLFLYWRKSSEKEFLLLGNTLAATTTILSFGLLAISQTTAVNSFGMAVFIGIVLNFFITTLFLGNTKCVKS